MKRALVAGATGYLGGFVIKEFKKQGYFVRALARNIGRLEHLQDSIDETVEAEVTRPDTLSDVCTGIDVVFSSIGITRQRDGLSFYDVDYRGNKNLLDVALEAGVGKFVYVSVLNGRHLRRLQIVDAHERFVDDLEASGLDTTVIRPTGYFSDMEAFLNMAKSGRVYIIGSGQSRMNPIHGADLASACVDAVESRQKEIAAGGPETMTYRDIAHLALDIAGKQPKITCIPYWLMRSVVAGTRIISRHQAELLSFFATASTSDNLAPAFGVHTLKMYFLECISRQSTGDGHH